MDWMKIGSVLLLGAMLVFIFPRMRHAFANTPKGTTKDWMGYLIPLLAVIGFVVFLIMMVR